MQTAGKTVGVAGFFLVELAASVQFTEDQFDRRPAFFRVYFNRNAAPVVADFDDAIGTDQYADFFGVTGERFVGGVVDDFLNEVGRSGCPGVHPGTFLDGFQVFQDADGGGGVFRHSIQKNRQFWQLTVLICDWARTGGKFGAILPFRQPSHGFYYSIDHIKRDARPGLACSFCALIRAGCALAAFFE